MEQEIKYKVTADTTEAKQAFKELNGEVDELKDVAERATSPIGKLEDAIEETRKDSDDTGKSISMLGGFLGGALAGGAALAVSALTKLAIEFVTSNEEIENLTAGVKDNWSEVFKATQEWNNFRLALEKFTAEELLESLNGIDTRVTQIGNKMVGFFSMFIQMGEFLGLTGFSEELDKLRKEQELISNQIKLNKEGEALKEMMGYNLFKKLGVYEDDPWKKQIKSIKENKEELTKLNFEFLKYLQSLEKMNNPDALAQRQTPNSGSVIGTGRRPTSRKSSPANIFTEEYMKNLELMNELSRSSAWVLRSEFSSAWQDIFGEANSLFEKLFADIAEKLASRAIGSFFSGFLNFIFPGAGTLAGGAMGGSNQPILNQINIDGRAVATIYTKGRSEAGRLRMS